MHVRALLLALLLGLAGPAWAGELDGTFPVGGAGRLVIALDFGSVALHAHDGDTVRIEALSRGLGASGVHFQARSENGDVILESDAEPWVGHLYSAPGVRVEAWVPRDTPVMLDGRGDVEVLREIGGVLVLSP